MGPNVKYAYVKYAYKEYCDFFDHHVPLSQRNRRQANARKRVATHRRSSHHFVLCAADYMDFAVALAALSR